MTTLGELYPTTKTVPFGTTSIEVTGISIRKLAALLDEYPEIASLLAGEGVAYATLHARAPDAALAVFALVVDDETTIRAFDNLPFGQQVDIIGAIYDLTLGGQRARPFLEAVIQQLRGDEEKKDEASPSASPSSSSSSPAMDTAETSVT
jgi:hypothetical protein